MSAMRVVLAGAAGRMGRVLVRTVLTDRECMLAGALEAPSHPDYGADAGRIAGLDPAGIVLSDDAARLLGEADALIDFTTPAVSVELAAHAAQACVVHVIGTTGFSAADETRIAEAAVRTPIVKSGNMSPGVALLAALVKRAARALPDFDISILEMHHRMKADAPSGTALLLGRAAADGHGAAGPTGAHPSRPASPGRAGDVEFASLRGGTVVGEHHVVLAGPHERLVLAHVAEDRSIFARGALLAAKWGRSRKPGLYSMADVLDVAD